MVVVDRGKNVSSGETRLGVLLDWISCITRFVYILILTFSIVRFYSISKWSLLKTMEQELWKKSLQKKKDSKRTEVSVYNFFILCLLFFSASEDGFQPMPSVTIRPADDNHLPSANTCISRLYVPLYSSKAVLKSKLLMAIKTKNFGFVWRIIMK